ncbi:MAG: DUF2061 domain-containing protein [Bacteroidota bacterium]
MGTGKESHLRSIMKGITWRVVATTTIILIALFKTGDISLALEIGAIEFFIKFALYYLHERAWQMAPRGSIRQLNPFRSRKKSEDVPVANTTKESASVKS